MTDEGPMTIHDSSLRDRGVLTGESRLSHVSASATSLSIAIAESRYILDLESSDSHNKIKHQANSYL